MGLLGDIISLPGNMLEDVANFIDNEDVDQTTDNVADIIKDIRNLDLL